MSTLSTEPVSGQTASEEQIQRLVHCPETLGTARSYVEELVAKEGGSRDHYLAVLNAKKVEMPEA